MKKLRGSSIKLSGEVNIASKEVVLKGKVKDMGKYKRTV